MLDSLWPHESQHTRPPCPSPSPGVHSHSRPLSRLCHPVISSSVVSFSSCPQSLPASVFSNESTLRMRWPKYWSFSFSIIPSKEIRGLISFRMDWLDLLAVQGTLKSLLQHHSSKPSILGCSSLLYGPTLTSIPDYWKNNKFGSMDLVSKVMLLLFKMRFRLVIAFLPKSKFLNFMAAVTICSDIGARQNKVCHCFCCFPSICHEVVGLVAMIFVFWMLSFKPTFSTPLSLLSRGSLVPLFFLPLGWCLLHVWGYWYFSQQSLFQLMLHPSRHFTWCTLYII